MGDLPATIGPYRIIRQLGEGGMGAVYEAVQEAIERRVAIKVLHAEYARNAEFTARFFNEARAVNRVGHPGLVQISDHGQQPDGTTYIVMELLEGESLARRLERRGGKLPPPEVIHLAWQLADSLAAAHGKGIIHRDLKPDNVMIVADPTGPGGERTKILDFGIAKVSENGATSNVKTKTDQVMGTPTYMSPEQCEGAGSVDAKSDVYSLGVMLFEMLAGQPPFTAQGGGKVLGMHMFVAPPLLRELAPTTPPPLCDLVQRLLTKSKEQRPAMRQVAAALESLGEQNPLPKRSGSMAAVGADGEEPNDTVLVLKSRPSTLGLSASQTIKQRPRLQKIGILAGVALLSVGTVTILATRQTDPKKGPQPMPDNSATAPQPTNSPVSTPLVQSPDMGVSVGSTKTQPDSGRRSSSSKTQSSKPSKPASPPTPVRPLPTARKQPPHAKPLED